MGILSWFYKVLESVMSMLLALLTSPVFLFLMLLDYVLTAGLAPWVKYEQTNRR